MKRFITRRGRPRKIYSDNGRTFAAAAKWLKGVVKHEQLQNYLAHQEIRWQFNLSRAPWWGGQFERLVGVVKRALYKSIGRASLTWNELEEVLLDVEMALNDSSREHSPHSGRRSSRTLNLRLFDPNYLYQIEESVRIRRLILGC